MRGRYKRDTARRDCRYRLIQSGKHGRHACPEGIKQVALAFAAGAPDYRDCRRAYVHYRDAGATKNREADSRFKVVTARNVTKFDLGVHETASCKTTAKLSPRS
jgi:hypothetical protein